MPYRGVLLLITGVLGLLTIGCTQFANNFERIDRDRIRLLDIVYDPPEALPGDTVRLKAVFAGEPVAFSDVDWQVSYNLPYNIFGADTALEIQPLDYERLDTSFSENTYTVALRFKVPDSIMYTSSMIPEDITAILAGNQVEIPEELASFSKSEAIQILDAFRVLETNPEQADQLLEQLDIPDSVKATFGSLVQLMTVRIRLFADVKGVFRTRSDYTIRYSRLFKDLPGFNVFENRNPRIERVGVYKVKGIGLQSFDPAQHSQQYETIWLNDWDNDTIAEISVEEGYSYFVMSEAGARDSALTIESSAAGNRAAVKLEEFRYTYWYQMDSAQIQDCSVDDYMNISPFQDSRSQPLAPPSKKTIEDFSLWVQVSDLVPGDGLRGFGSSLKEVRGRFSYKD